MGLLFSRLWSYFTHEEHKLVIIGLDNAGKTTILYQFLMEEVVHTSPTLGSNVEEVVWKNIHFVMWDIGGQESIRQGWQTYYTNTEYIILVVDSTDRERIGISKEELWKMLAHDDLRKAGVLIYANKQDVKGCMTAAQISKELNLTAIKKHKWQIQACCALTGEGYVVLVILSMISNSIVLWSTVCCGDANTCIEVNTSSGSVRGQTLHVLNRKIHQFLNIPYAEPPLGPLRFAPPLPLRAPKQGIIDGTKSGNHCIQKIPKFGVLTGNEILSEDCLVLNIWTPNVDNSNENQRKSDLKSVMFWIYGGGLSMGSIFRDKNNGSVLSTNDVVVVTVNYRVGPLGFFYGGDETAPGNAGFYDQLLALKWVRENIHLFGGDKDQITIFGFSAGSWSVSAHILSPLSKGLFKRAIMQSGSVMYNRERPALSTV
ncbi:unnamed protein product, partial [Medioppia subpectinata]